MSAKNDDFRGKVEQILGVPVTFVRFQEVLDTFKTIVAERNRASSRSNQPYFVITANPEFILHARDSARFAQVMQSADLVIPDGVALAQARYYFAKNPETVISKILVAGDICLKTLTGQFHDQTVPGVALVRALVAQQDMRVFLLGGWDGVVERLGKQTGHDYYQGPASILDAAPEELQALFAAIKKSHPDILLVSFAHFKQEQWIYDHLKELDTKIVMGVGTSFNEILGEYHWKRKTPVMMSRMGLKWLWRVIIEPKHIKRVWRALIVFPWTLAFGTGKA